MAVGDIRTHEFMGREGFLWWIGVVEDRDDPLKLGRARVRIFGHHNSNLELLPTEKLPWALAVTPLSNSDAPKSPPEATWVLGVFLDGPLGQQPLMLAAIPGLRYRDVVENKSDSPNLP